MTDVLSLPEMETQLAAAQADLALYERLTDAAARVKTLTAARDKALAANAKAEADRVRAAEETRFAGLRDLRITEIPDSKSPGVLSTRFNIQYTRNAYNSAAGTNLPQRVSITGFTALERDILAWIVQRHPDKIPASILALAPGNVDAALDRYFLALRRGFLAS